MTMAKTVYTDFVAQHLAHLNDDEEGKYFTWSKYAEYADRLMGRHMTYFEWLDRYGLK